MSATLKSVSIIIPTLNEAENIRGLVSQIIASGISFHELLFVDANSTDGTPEIIRALAIAQPVRLIVQDGGSLGLAAAIMTGARAAHGEFLLVMDADLSHPPDRIADLLAPLLAGTADMVIGSRYVSGGSTPGWPFWRRMLSRLASALAYPLTGLQDSMCGFFAIARSQLLELAPATIGFKIAFETIVSGKGRLRMREVPISFRNRSRGQSKMSFGIALRFFLRWLRAILWRLLGLASSSKRADLDRYQSRKI